MNRPGKPSVLSNGNQARSITGLVFFFIFITPSNPCPAVFQAFFYPLFIPYPKDSKGVLFILYTFLSSLLFSRFSSLHSDTNFILETEYSVQPRHLENRRKTGDLGTDFNAVKFRVKSGLSQKG